MPKTYDRVADTTTSSGTGTITLTGSAPGGYRAFSGAALTGDVVYYALLDASGGNAWEVGYGTLTSGTNWTLTRNLLASSSGALLALSGGTTQVWCDWPARQGVPPRVFSEASSSAPTPNADQYDIHIETALSVAPTIAAPTGTPFEGQPLFIFLTDNGTARALSWNAAYAATTVTLPATTVASTRLRVSFVYNSTTGKWDCIGAA